MTEDEQVEYLGDIAMTATNCRKEQQDEQAR